jgi:hypothetical protein
MTYKESNDSFFRVGGDIDEQVSRIAARFATHLIESLLLQSIRAVRQQLSQEDFLISID